MATRNITDIFMLMRDNAAQNRQLVSEHNHSPRASDRMSLVDMERGGGGGGTAGGSYKSSLSPSSRLPPDWVDSVEEAHYEISRVREKLTQLRALHSRSLQKPSLEETRDEERAVEVTTGELGHMFHRCERLVSDIRRKTAASSPQERRIATNVVHALATTLTELTTTFRKDEGTYLKRLRTREERSRTFFPDTLSSSTTGRSRKLLINDDLNPQQASDEQQSSDWFGQFHMSDQLLEDNTELVEQRERSIVEVVQSIGEMRTIFKDLSGIIVEQGTILDRIDYNVEQTCVRVESGYRQLQKAERYQKKNKKMYIIALLFIVTLILIIILIATRT